jgi:hypothetical protein
MAVYWSRTAEITWGKDAQAIEWAVRIMNYLNDTFPAPPGEVLTNVGADLAEIHWVRRFESLAEMEKVSAMMDADEKLDALTKEMVDGGFLRAASDRLYRVLL